MNLPMINFATSLLTRDLDDCYIIGVQHLLPTTLSMFQALIKKGLKPQNISLIGKCYSTDLETYQAMKNLGFDICDTSIEFDSHQAFDHSFKRNIRNFLNARKERLNSSGNNYVIVLDDGGELLEEIGDYLIRFEKIFGMEQTSSGYQKLSVKNHPIPIINLARAKAKLEIEPKYIIRNSLEKIYASLQDLKLTPKKALIIGNGAIGSAVYKYLHGKLEVTRFDVDPNKCDYHAKELESLLATHDLIIGCTGITSVPSNLHSKIQPGSVLVSLSSSDREFDSYYFRKNLAPTTCCYDHIKHNGIILLNCGFPITFNGFNVDNPNFFQFVRALIISCIAQGINQPNSNTGIVDLEARYQNQILEKFKEIEHSCDEPCANSRP